MHLVEQEKGQRIIQVNRFHPLEKIDFMAIHVIVVFCSEVRDLNLYRTRPHLISYINMF